MKRFERTLASIKDLDEVRLCGRMTSRVKHYGGRELLRARVYTDLKSAELEAKISDLTEIALSFAEGELLEGIKREENMRDNRYAYELIIFESSLSGDCSRLFFRAQFSRIPLLRGETRTKIYEKSYLYSRSRSGLLPDSTAWQKFLR